LLEKGRCSVFITALRQHEGTHFPKDVILYAVFFYVRYGVSYRDLEEIMEERVCATFIHNDLIRKAIIVNCLLEKGRCSVFITALRPSLSLMLATEPLTVALSF
jgi:hypothetical protein